ncbi:hypothetical protein GCM10011419_20640 [Vogesella fluminis]|uniref:Glycosyl transferase family 1 domain-containing protein n=2 Tax=Vogesella fluminis TaxID=1069161 RepID=A0ABQ3HA58_9NEIS|nr:hypothetical protein GCM10011419_20640 [Vogesella fluminis]
MVIKMLDINSQKPILALFSPLPPDRSGIADYTMELIPELLVYYRVVIISDKIIDINNREGGYEIRDTQWFKYNYKDIDRVLYKIGNSHYHFPMFDLLNDYPGVVVMHDVILSDAMLEYTNRIGVNQEAILYQSHGYKSLIDLKFGGLKNVLGKYACSDKVIKNSFGAIIHSDFAKNKLSENYGKDICNNIKVVPFLPRRLNLPSRTSARNRLNIPESEWVVCCFGFLGPTKMNKELIEVWNNSFFSLSDGCCLVFVGSMPSGEYSNEIKAEIWKATNINSISITGFVEQQEYIDYMAAADLAVQLRQDSRGETSAAVFDCLSAGLPVICNNHGFIKEISNKAVMKISENFDMTELQLMLEKAFFDKKTTMQFACNAKADIDHNNNNTEVGRKYHAAIEYFYECQKNSLPVGSMLDGLGRLDSQVIINSGSCELKKILIDISAIVRHDLKTGIERVVRSIVNELLTNPPEGYRVEPIYFNETGGYDYARKYVSAHFFGDKELLQDEAVSINNGDVFIGADLLLSAIPNLEECLQEWRKSGARIIFIVYDLLPLKMPECFPPFIEHDYKKWLKTICRVSHQLVCISGAVADELDTCIREEHVETAEHLQISSFHLGADIKASLPSAGISESEMDILGKLESATVFLMVSTIEPRKGHVQVLDAFELLWEKQIFSQLVIIGKPGWMTDNFMERLRTHPENGKRLFCLFAVSDEVLDQVYKRADCLLAASRGEGFGLPLIEAAQYGLPLLVRDIPVFREIAGENASYFTGHRPEDLAAAIRHWLETPEAERIQTDGMTWQTWQQSVGQLLCTTGIKPERD